MYEALSRCVKPEDTLYHIGDFAFGNYDLLCETFARLPECQKMLVFGNHDARNLKHMRKLPWPVVKEKSILYRGLSFLFRHHPLTVEEETKVTADIVVTGHVHDRGRKFKFNGVSLLVCACVELWDYSPIPIDTLVETYVEMGGCVCPNSK